MNRVTKISLTIFIVLTIISMISVFLNAKESMFLILFLILLFNSSLGLLVILMANKIVKISKRGYPLFIMYLILSLFIFWYVGSSLLEILYGSFISLGGFYFLLSVGTWWMAVLFYISSGLIILALAFFLYHISRKTILEKNHYEKIINEKVINEKIKMNRVTKISFIMFLVLTIISMGSIFLRDNRSMILILLTVLLFNSSLGLLIILMANKIVKISKKGYPLLMIYLTLSFFVFWYFMSTLLHYYYGSFLSLGGFYYFIATRTLFMAFIFYILSGLTILALTFLLYYLSRKTIFEENPPEKIMNKKIKILLIFAPILILILIVLVVPIFYYQL